MSLSPEQYLALTKLANYDFGSSDEGLSITDLLGLHVIEGEGQPVLAALSNMGGYTLINFQPNTTSGFAGAAFQAPPGPNGEPGEIVFALRGTEPNLLADFTGALNDFRQDLEIALDANLSGPSQFDDAFAFWNSTLQTPNLNYSGYSFTGHSLGGGLAQYMTYMTNEVGHSTTFNAVGIGQVLDGVNPSDYNDSITDYVNQNDIIGQYGTQLGQTFYKTDTGNYQFNSAVDNGQLALQMAIMQAMQQGSITQAAGMAALNALSEAHQSALNAESDVFFGAHGLDAMISPNGSMSQTVDDPNAAIEMLTQVINGSFTVTGWIVDGINYFAVEIVPKTPLAATFKITLAILEGDVQIAIAFGETVYNFVNFMGNTAADIIYNAAVAIGNATNTVAEAAVNLYQYFFGDYLIINGTDNADSLSLYRYSDKSVIINGLDGNDSIVGSDHDDALDGGLGNDTISAWDGNDYIYGKSGDDMLYGNSGNDVLIGDSGEDVLDGGEGDDVLVGGAHDDELRGDSGDDILTGGLGNDILNGGYGSDTYVFNLGDGHDFIYGSDYDPDTDTIDTVRFGAGILPSNITVLQRAPSDYYTSLELQIAGTNDTLTIGGYFGSRDNNDSTLRRVENIVFKDGTVWDYATLYSKVHNQIGSVGSDDLRGLDAGSYTISGLGGDDYLSGGSGNDTLSGGDGDDNLEGSFGDDLLAGGVGNDMLSDLDGNDTYLFELGDGQDTIYDYAGTDTIQFAAGITPNDVEVKRVERYSETMYGTIYYDLELNIVGTADKITVQQFFGYNGGGSQNQAIEQITFADGTVWTPSTIYDKVHNLVGTAGDDWISAYDEGAVNYQGLAGNDYLIGSYGNDVLDGGEGADYLSGDGGNDVLLGGAGDDSISGGDGNDVLNGGIGNDTLYDGGGNDIYVFALGDGQDTISDYTGIDSIQFDASISPEDMIVKRVSRDGAGHYDLELSILNTSNSLTIQNYFGFGGSDGPQSSEDNMIEQFTFADGTIWTTSTIYDRVDNVSSTSGDDFIFTYDSVAATLHGLAGNDTLVGNNGNDVLHGDSGEDTLSGGNGDDILDGEAGNDVIYGGAGNDTITGGTDADELRGGAGDDNYIFALGDGHDTIFETDGTDTIQFGAGINPADVTVRRIPHGFGSGIDLEIVIAGTDDMLTVSGHFGNIDDYGQYQPGVGQEIESIVFDDGTVWNGATIYDKARNFVPTAGDDVMFAPDNDPVSYHGLDGNDSLHGGAGNDSLYGDNGGDSLYAGGGDNNLYGDSGNDSLYGSDGVDMIFGGTGSDVLMGGSSADTLDGGDGDDSLTGGYDNDVLDGGSGNDIYSFGWGEGQDVIYDNNGIDTTALDRNLLSLMFERVGDDLRVVMSESSDSITVNGWYESNDNKIETFKAWDSSWNDSSISSDQIEQLIQAMASWSNDNGGMSWSQALSSNPQDVQAVVSQYWTAPTV